ncbi:septum formation inhibitor Maf [Robiginitalea sp. IMCC43444]|uniref:septum formation inhibitor Maf n=1 Tax=Robiginitalea sp. IMCC43444 TaxID=3459121 RepID=UPI0040410645
MYRMKTSIIHCILVSMLALFTACGESPQKDAPAPTQPVTETNQLPPAKPLSESFKDYWYAGVAELNSYEISEARYGELREGHAVLIYVTEPFNTGKQVKADRPDDQSVSVLKLNRTKKYLTGIYPYSIMSSIFYPVSDNQHALKVSTSVQEWCGHVYMQLNNRESFQIQSHSYFESEADQDITLSKEITEDELWTKLRIDPESLPTGEHQLLPSLEYLRLKHLPIKAYKAVLTLSDPGQLRTYTITYPELNRSLQLHFEGSFPYVLQGWTETQPAGFGDNSGAITSTAQLKKRINTPYWRQNSNKDIILRDSLGL